MQFLADECIPAKTVFLLQDNGFKVKTVKNLDLCGKSDSIIFNKSVLANLILITVDSDFGNILLYPPKTHPGIIVIKLTKSNENKIHSLLIEFLKKSTVKTIKNTLTIIDSNKIRIRK